MTSKEITESLSLGDITNILYNLGASKVTNRNEILYIDTFCHGGNSQKLYYYTNNKTFHCYTHCGQIGSIFDLVMKVLNLEFIDAYKYVCNFFGIKGDRVITTNKIDNSFTKKFKKVEEEEYDLKVYDKDLLNNFNDLFHESWIKDNISINTMKKFNIKFDILNNRIIIPHFDKDDNLIGIRCRNLNEYELAQGKKYTPITIDNITYKYPIHANFYGLNVTKENIKKYKRVILVESEKSCMQFYTYYKDESIAIAVSGSSIGVHQIKMLLELGVESVVIAMDKDFIKANTEEDFINRKKIKRAFIDKLKTYFSVEIIWDFDDELDINSSPTDKGKEIWESLYSKRIFV